MKLYTSSLSILLSVFASSTTASLRGTGTTKARTQLDLLSPHQLQKLQRAIPINELDGQQQKQQQQQQKQQQQKQHLKRQQRNDLDRSLFVSTPDAIPFEAVGSAFASSVGNVATNEAGDIVAVASNSLQSGVVQVYQFINDLWTQIGSDIVVTATSTQRSTEVTLNKNGTVLAITEAHAQDNDVTQGTVRLYEFDTTTNVWSQVGNDISAGFLWPLGTTAALNADGDILAVGVTDSTLAGKVQVYQRSGSALTMTDEVQESDNSFGQYVSLNDDGDILAVGAPLETTSNGDQSGRVRVYSKPTGASIFTQLGSSLDGQSELELCGVVSLNDDGTILAVGSWNRVPGTSFQGDNDFQAMIHAYEWDTTTSTWNLKGRAITENVANFPLYQLSISSAGDRILTTSLEYAHLYEFQSNTWVAVYDTPQLTISATLSGSGDRVAAAGYVSAAVEVFKEVVGPGREDDTDNVQYFTPLCDHQVPFGYRFISKAESRFQNYQYVPNADDSALATACDANDKCVGFNSDGFLKMAIRSSDDPLFIPDYYDDECDGLFVKLSCTPVKAFDECNQPIPCGYEFHSQKQVLFYTYNPLGVGRDVFEYAEYCDKDPDCAGFDSNGLTKREIASSDLIPSANDRCWGTYVKSSTS
uniref:Uncharacterized protein n=1 Tax=Cyclophora tenuis TaxID=216820 RepID=A0A7S1GLG2_CYCTE|mmetsp:Transcript_22121/g.37649  ORF Transcript_22121/g.37649 Transcript_22121/m.37649 type:complete len:644 (+) Transcript_22121:47-1978(+)